MGSKEKNMRHLAKLQITGELVAQWLSFTTLPKGAELVGSSVNGDGMLELCFSHRSFDKVPEGGIPPLITT